MCALALPACSSKEKVACSLAPGCWPLLHALNSSCTALPVNQEEGSWTPLRVQQIFRSKVSGAQVQRGKERESRQTLLAPTQPASPGRAPFSKPHPRLLPILPWALGHPQCWGLPSHTLALLLFPPLERRSQRWWMTQLVTGPQVCFLLPDGKLGWKIF